MKICVNTHNMTFKDFASPEQCLCFNFRRASRVITRSFDEALASAGMTTAQFSSLYVLKSNGPMTVSKFAKAMETERTTLTRNLTLLEKEGLVSRATGEDRRQKVVAITAKGIRKLQAALPAWKAAQKRAVDRLGDRTMRAMLENTALIERKMTGPE